MEKKPQESLLKAPFRSNKLLLAIGLCAGITAGWAYYYTAPKSYESELTLFNPAPNSPNASLLSATVKTPATEKITSRPYLATALDGPQPLISYFVEQDYQRTPSSYETPFKAEYKLISKSFYRQEYEVVPIDDNNYQLISEIHGIRRVKEGIYGKQLIDNNLAITITKKDHVPYHKAPQFTETKYIIAIDSPGSLADQLSEGNIAAAEQNGVVTINCKAATPEMAALAANQIGNHFIGNEQTTNGTDASVESIDQRINALAEDLKQKEALVAAYKSENQITELSIDAQKNLSLLEQQQLQKTQLDLQMASLDNISNYLRKNRDGNNSLVEYGAISDPSFNDQIQQLNSKYQSASAAPAEIEALKNQIAERVLNTRKRIAVQQEALAKQIAQTRGQLATIPEKAHSLETLERAMQLDRKVYDLLIDKRAQAIVGGQVISGPGSILKPASSSATPVAPVLWLIMTIGAVSGLTISYLISLFFAQLRHSRIHERNEIDETKGIPFIGNVAMDSNNPLALKESFNNLCTKILLKQDVKMITITSTSSGEGKTFIATNLAKAYSAMDKKVLLIDMNSYHPEIADLFEITNDKTIADVLEGRCDVHDAVCLTSFPNLDILVSGMLPEGVNSLLASKKREELFKDLQRHYDLIIIDTPESGRFIDAVPMMKQSQLNLYVARAKATRKQSLVNAELIQQDYDVENMYFILNSITKQTTHTGKIGRGSYKKLKSPESQKVKVSYVPEALRKIALWFY